MKDRPGTLRKLIQDDSPKRQAILNAALELFAERGFHGTTVPEVAERAGVGAGTVYRYFESKEALVNAVYQHWKADYGRHLVFDLPFDAPARELFHQIWKRMGEYARNNPTVLAFLELHHHRAYLDKPSKDLERRILEPIHHFVKESQEKKALKSGSPEVLIAIVYGAFGGILRAGGEGYLKLTDETFLEAERCVWEAIRG